MKSKKKFLITIILLFVMMIGVGYAILQANLEINGTTKIGSNTWNVHFQNIQISSGSVEVGTGDSSATIDPENNCKVDFSVTLNVPGDYYEFTVDVVNAGTIDAMIGTLTKTLKVDGVIVENVPSYLNYTVTYSDGSEILQNHKLAKNTTETYKVRVEYRSDIDELPDATTFSTSIESVFVQADSGAVQPYHEGNLYKVFRLEAEGNTGYVHEYEEEHKDSFTEVGNQKIYHWYADTDSTANIILDKWNVIFGGFCWQMWRTTDTGGVKMIYNGVPSDGKCTATREEQQIGTTAFNSSSNSPAYVGYMYNPSTLITNKGNGYATSGSLFGQGVSYSDGVYILTDTSTTYDANHHYTCNDTIGSCSTVRYYYFGGCYIELSDGRSVEEALEDMLSSDDVNQTNSTIKTYIDTWYQNNMTSYTSKLEDTIFCSNRSIMYLGGWNPNGGVTNNILQFQDRYYNTDLSCVNITDQFSMNNEKAHLTYPIGLMSFSEAFLLNNRKLIITGGSYWLGSPYAFENGNAYGRREDLSDYYIVSNAYGVRPAISLKPGTNYTGGDGSKNNPYIVE